VGGEQLSAALERYRTLDPVGWVAFYRVLPVYAGLALVLIGGVLLAWGSGRAVRLLTVPIGVLVGGVGIPALLEVVGMHPLESRVRYSLAAGLGVLCGIAPPVAFFVGVGGPVGWVIAQLVGTANFLFAFVPACLLSGAAAVLQWRRLAAVLSSATGAWLLVLGLFAALDPLLPSLGLFAVRYPIAALCVAGVLAVIGLVLQLTRAEEEARRAHGGRRVQIGKLKPR
jgi:hypothetical protein